MARSMELEEKAHAHDAPKMIPTTSAVDGPPKADGRGLVWVDGETMQSLGPVSTEPFKPPMKATSPVDMLGNEKQAAVATMQPVDRSMYMWRKINPGCMRSTISVPSSAMKDHFKMRDGLDNSAVIDKATFRKKVRVVVSEI